MNAIPHLDIICHRVVESYRRAYGDSVRAIFLYGSYARGDFDEESDIDFAAIVDGERLDLQRKSLEPNELAIPDFTAQQTGCLSAAFKRHLFFLSYIPWRAIPDRIASNPSYMNQLG